MAYPTRRPSPTTSLAVIFLAFVLPLTVRADGLDDLARHALQAQRIPGLAVLVTRDGQVLRRAAYGEASLELHTPLSADDRFEIGSITKAFTATLVMKLVEEGKLSLQDPVGKYLTQAPAAWKDITVERLLSHESGLKDYAFVPGLELLEHWTMQDWWAKMPSLPLDFAPGSDAEYSNTDYVLLGLIVEKIEGRPFQEIVTDQIIQPLGLTHTVWNSDETVIDGRAQGYLTRRVGIINRPPITETDFDGGLLSTVDDLARFDAGLRGGKILRPETLARMRTAMRLPGGHRSPFGLCWWVSRVRGHPMISHGGQSAGYAANLSWFPDERLSVVVLTNLSDANADLLAHQAAGLYAPEVAIQKLLAAPDPDPAFSAKLCAALRSLAAGEAADPDLLDPTYAATLATPRGERGLAALTPFKDVSSLTFLEIEPNDPDRIFRYRVRTDGKSFVVAFVVTKQSRIYAVATRQETTP